MGKKKITTAEETTNTETTEAAPAVETSKKVSGKKRFENGILNVDSTYNNTKLVLSDPKGNVLAWSTSGVLGFRGAKKGTPFAAAKIGEVLGEKAAALGMKEVRVVVKGVGSGRESAIRGFISKGINLTTIVDMTPVPHNGPKAPRPRRA
jgi:small subunit ribosomal protein S11